MLSPTEAGGDSQSGKGINFPEPFVIWKKYFPFACTVREMMRMDQEVVLGGPQQPLNMAHSEM